MTRLMKKVPMAAFVTLCCFGAAYGSKRKSQPRPKRPCYTPDYKTKWVPNHDMEYDFDVPVGWKHAMIKTIVTPYVHVGHTGFLVKLIHVPTLRSPTLTIQKFKENILSNFDKVEFAKNYKRLYGIKKDAKLWSVYIWRNGEVEPPVVKVLTAKQHAQKINGWDHSDSTTELAFDEHTMIYICMGKRSPPEDALTRSIRMRRGESLRDMLVAPHRTVYDHLSCQLPGMVPNCPPTPGRKTSSTEDGYFDTISQIPSAPTWPGTARTPSSIPPPPSDPRTPVSPPPVPSILNGDEKTSSPPALATISEVPSTSTGTRWADECSEHKTEDAEAHDAGEEQSFSSFARMHRLSKSTGPRRIETSVKGATTTTTCGGRKKHVNHSTTTWTSDVASTTSGTIQYLRGRDAEPSTIYSPTAESNLHIPIEDAGARENFPDHFGFDI